jgi:hypothetical protein
MIRAPRLPPATVIDQRSLYTRADMIEFYRLGYVTGRDSDDFDPSTADDVPTPSDSKFIDELMGMFGMKK